MNMIFSGRVWKLGDDIDTDIILPTQWLTLGDMEKVKMYAFSPLRPELAKAIKPGDIIVAGKNFGCGSSREMAPEAIARLGVSCIVAKSFARIFFRNAINNGLLLIECDLCHEVSESDIIGVEINKCIRVNGKIFPIPKISDNVFKILEAGGLVNYMKALNHK
jgi:3-isopropylmalate/(R)-2-methylmalate dehydratase small subunit